MIYSYISENHVVLSVVAFSALLILFIVMLIVLLKKTRRSLNGVFSQTVYRYIPCALISAAFVLIANSLFGEIYGLYKYKNEPQYIEGEAKIENVEEINKMGAGTYYHISVSIQDKVFDLEHSNLYEKGVLDSINDHPYIRITYVTEPGGDRIWDIESADAAAQK